MTTLAPMTPDDMPAVVRMLSHAFASDRPGVAGWLESGGVSNARVLREGQTPAGCLLRIPMGQFFGGRSVPMIGIAGVAVPPEARGRGVAKAMMTECVREIAREGVALSALYCSTQALYRQVGYEQAGVRFQTRIATHWIRGMPKARSIRALDKSDEPHIQACYRAWATRHDGSLDRGAYIWNRIRTLRGVESHPFGVFENGRLTGYIFLSQARDPNLGRHDINLSDVVFLTADAGRQLLSFLADFEPTANDVVFHGAPHHPILSLLSQQRYKSEFRDAWMVRITHLSRALEARGYPPGARGVVVLRVHDPIVPENDGLWTLRVEGGHARAERGGDESRALTCSINGLAALFTGWMTPAQAVFAGWCGGTDETLAAAGAVFCGGSPWMTDFF